MHSQHLPEGWPKDFPLPSVVTEQVGVKVEYTNRETMVWLEVEPISVHVPTKVRWGYTTNYRVRKY